MSDDGRSPTVQCTSLYSTPSSTKVHTCTCYLLHVATVRQILECTVLLLATVATVRNSYLAVLLVLVQVATCTSTACT
jgi:hypothetical protein